MKRSSRLRRFLQVLGLLLLASGLTGLSSLSYLAHLWSGRRHFAPVAGTRDLVEAAIHPIGGRGRHAEAGQRVAAALQVGGVPPWEAGSGDPVVTVIVGQDHGARAQTSEVLADTNDDHRTDRP